MFGKISWNLILWLEISLNLARAIGDLADIGNLLTDCFEKILAKLFVFESFINENFYIAFCIYNIYYNIYSTRIDVYVAV